VLVEPGEEAHGLNVRTVRTVSWRLSSRLG